MTNQKISNAQEELLNIIMDITQRLCRDLDRNLISEARRLYEIRSEKMDILSRIKTSDIVSLPNYPMFVACLHNFDDRFCRV